VFLCSANDNIKEGDTLLIEFIEPENKVCSCNYAISPADLAVLHYADIKHCGPVTYLRVSRARADSHVTGSATV